MRRRLLVVLLQALPFNSTKEQAGLCLVTRAGWDRVRIIDAYHGFRLRTGLADNCGVSLGTARKLPFTGKDVGKHFLAQDDRVALAWAALLVGFSCSLFFCQRARERAAASFQVAVIAVKLTDLGATAVLDLAAASSLQALCVYVENVGLLGTGSERRRPLGQGVFGRMRHPWRPSA